MEQTLKAGAIGAERVRRIDDLINRPAGATVFHRMDEPRVGSMLTTVLPFRFSTGSFPAPSPAPTLGQHRNEVLRDWLGLAEEEIQALDNQGVFT